MEATYGALAVLVLALHSVFALWVLAGGVVARRSRRLILAHAVSAAWGFFATVSGVPCPLTQLENHFRGLGGIATYSEECIPHYVWAPLGVGEGVLPAVLLIGTAVLLNYLAYRPRRLAD